MSRRGLRIWWYHVSVLTVPDLRLWRSKGCSEIIWRSGVTVHGEWTGRFYQILYISTLISWDASKNHLPVLSIRRFWDRIALSINCYVSLPGTLENCLLCLGFSQELSLASTGRSPRLQSSLQGFAEEGGSIVVSYRPEKKTKETENRLELTMTACIRVLVPTCGSEPVFLGVFLGSRP